MHNAQQLLQYIEENITGIKYPAEPAGLYEPIRYAMQAGGKRLRRCSRSQRAKRADMTPPAPSARL